MPGLDGAAQAGDGKAGDIAADVTAAMDRGLAYLARQQQRDGSFLSYSSASMEHFRRLRSWQTVFVPALMLSSLSELVTPVAQAIRQRLAGFLLDQKTDDWSFNYWSKQAPEYRAQAYPNDLDDTFCALAGLYRHDPGLVDEAAMARIIKLLLATEASVGGPYRTWLTTKDSDPVWLDVDVAVNSNIAYFLSLAGHRLPKLDAFIGQAIRADAYASPYYPSKYAFVYYFARSYHGPYRSQLLRQTRKLHAAADNDLNRALCLSARLHLGDKHPASGRREIEDTAKSLLNDQRRDGSWPAAAFYADPVKHGRPYYNGAATLTTAFALEALALYQQAKIGTAADRRTADSLSSPRASSRRRSRRRPVLSLAADQCHSLDPALRDQLLTLLRRLAGSGNGPTILDVPYNFNHSLIDPLQPEPAKTFDILSLANLYGWLAYTIYDDFLDEEGKPANLPAANVALRYSLENFDRAAASPSFHGFIHRTFDVIDGANAWEQAHCRFRVSDGAITLTRLPHYGNRQKLAERSLGHSLPALTVLTLKDIRPASQPFRLIDRALRHYLIVRQLNDDLHDWPEDLARGHISYVVARLLRELRLRPGTYQLADLSRRAQRRFWRRTLPAVCQLMRGHIAGGRQAFAASGLLKQGSVMEQLLDDQESSLTATIAQQRQAMRFLQQYKQVVS